MERITDIRDYEIREEAGDKLQCGFYSRSLALGWQQEYCQQMRYWQQKI